jgi:hypothetical protein
VALGHRWAARAAAGLRGGGARSLSFSFLFPYLLFFPIFLSFILSYFLHDVKSNSLLNKCSTKITHQTK